MQTSLAWPISLRAHSLESGWRPKPGRVDRHFEISLSLGREHIWHHIAEWLANDAPCGSNSKKPDRAITSGLPTIRK
jgi:hypothetical protein